MAKVPSPSSSPKNSWRPALSDILSNLFQNKISHKSDQKTVKTIFSRVHLADIFNDSLVCPERHKLLDTFLVCQTDTFIDNKLTENMIQLISFLMRDGYIYGYYYHVLNHNKYDYNTMIKSKHPITLEATAAIMYSGYLEIYNDINGIPISLGLSSDPLSASLQYGHKSNYYHETLTNVGLSDISIPKTKLTGISRNILNNH